MFTPWARKNLDVPYSGSTEISGPSKYWQNGWEASAAELTVLLLNAPTKRAGPGAPLAKGPLVASVRFPEPKLQGQVGDTALPLGRRKQLLTVPHTCV